MNDETRTAVLAAGVGVLVLAAAIGQLSLSLSADGATAGPADPPADDARLEAVHAVGVTGENVTVGVVDATGFDADHPALDGRVVDARAFGRRSPSADGGRTAHGTRAAAVVARVAPDADLYLAAFDGATGYEAAVEWLLRAGVDVVVAPASFYGKPGDGSARVSRVATAATRRGVVFVAAAGNLGRGHWTGRYDRVRDGAAVVGGGVRNYLVGRDRRVTLWLSWDRAHAGEDYTAELYRTAGGETRLVARSQPYAADGVPNERIVARLQPGRYFVVVRGPPNATAARLTLESPTHDLEHATGPGSLVAPATARGVLAVGAFDARRSRVEPFSSRGPTRDGRLGVDVVAPDRQPTAAGGQFVGTSAAAAYVGGLAALLLDADPGLAPRQVEEYVERTAVDVGDSGVDAGAGHGRVDPWWAVRVARNATG